MIEQRLPGFEKMSTFNVIEAAKYLGISRQAIYFAISRKKLKASKEGNKFFTSQEDLDEYIKKRHKRRFTLKLKDDHFTIAETAKLLKLDKSIVYRLVKKKRIDFYRIGTAYIITQKTIDDFKKKKD